MARVRFWRAMAAAMVSSHGATAIFRSAKWSALDGEQASEVTENDFVGSVESIVSREGLWNPDSNENNVSSVTAPMRSLMTVNREPCGAETQDAFTKQGTTATRVMDAFKESRPNGLFQHDDGQRTCLTNTKEKSDEGFHGNTQVLTLVRESGAPICSEEKSEDKSSRFQTIEPQTFSVEGKEMKARHPTRNYAVVWPQKGNCADAGCPMVVALAGMGQHSPLGADDTKNHQSFDKLKEMGFLHYVEHDKDCYDKLSTVMMFVQLAENETWVSNAKDVHENFVVPLVRQIVSKNPGKINEDQISIVGYDEGAIGALQAVAHHPELFSLGVLAAPSIPQEWWQTVQTPPLNPRAHWNSDDWKLKMVVVAIGEYDFTADQASNLKEIVRVIDGAGLQFRAALDVRLYAKLQHDEVGNRVFNRWNGFHEVAWRGNYKALRSPEL